MTTQKHGFQTEVTKLLDLLANSLYSNKEVFLRELISNASDAIDKLHFLSLTNPDLIKDDSVFKIRIRADKETKTLTISDNGLGLTLDEANTQLGTIAKSGTEEFFKTLSGDAARDSQLIGQFGVGFYSSFIVADKVTVLSRSAKAAPEEGIKWESEGTGTFESGFAPRDARGTDIILHLKESETGFLEEWTLRDAITKYSDHISVPVELYVEKTVTKDKDEDDKSDEKKEPETEWVWEQVNDAKALWTRSAKDIKDEEYKEFYKHIASDYQDPLSWSHNKVEGETEYTSLLYVPSHAPWDLFMNEHKHGLKLYVQRVFIMDEAEQFLPRYLRFIKGLVDTNALPLNISRELLQESAITSKLKKALTKRALGMIEKLAKDPKQYETFYQNFGSVLKEGPVEDWSNRETVLSLLRFASTRNDNDKADVSLDDYLAAMKEKQDKIYYLTASNYEAAASSPYLESLKKKGIEVLLLTERIDEWLMSNISEYKEKRFVSVTAPDLELGDLEDEKEKEALKQAQEGCQDLTKRFKDALGDEVKEVRVSTRLIDSPSCVVNESGRMFTEQMKRILEATGQKMPQETWILELNPEHELVKKAAEQEGEAFNRYAKLIFGEALLSDAGSLKDPRSYVNLVNDLILGKAD